MELVWSPSVPKCFQVPCFRMSVTHDASPFNRTNPQCFDCSRLFYLGYLKHSKCWSINPKSVCQNSKNHINVSEMLMFWANPKGWSTIWSHFCFSMGFKQVPLKDPLSWSQESQQVCTAFASPWAAAMPHGFFWRIHVSQGWGYHNAYNVGPTSDVNVGL